MEDVYSQHLTHWIVCNEMDKGQYSETDSEYLCAKFRAKCCKDYHE